MISLILLLFRIYEVIIIIRVLFSWIQLDPYNPIVIWIYRLTEPVLYPIRQLIHAEKMGLDLSPLIVLFMMEILERVLIQSIGGY